MSILWKVRTHSTSLAGWETELQAQLTPMYFDETSKTGFTVHYQVVAVV